MCGVALDMDVTEVSRRERRLQIAALARAVTDLDTTSSVASSRARRHLAHTGVMRQLRARGQWRPHSPRGRRRVRPNISCPHGGVVEAAKQIPALVAYI